MELTVDERTAPGRPDVTIVAPSGEIDLATAPLLREGLERAEAHAPSGLVIDLRGVSFIDSTGIGELSGLAFRIGHLGSLNELEVLGTLGGIELAFADLGLDIELGSGLLAAQRSFTRPAVMEPERLAVGAAV